MPTSRSVSISETTSLLEDAPPSYRSTDDVDATFPESEVDVNPQPLNKFSRQDTYWILAGLWSAVLLGAFDGVDINFNQMIPVAETLPGTVVATLLTPIGSEFNASNQSSYIGTSYLLSVCCFTPLYGNVFSSEKARQS